MNDEVTPPWWKHAEDSGVTGSGDLPDRMLSLAEASLCDHEYPLHKVTRTGVSGAIVRKTFIGEMLQCLNEFRAVRVWEYVVPSGICVRAVLVWPTGAIDISYNDNQRGLDQCARIGVSEPPKQDQGSVSVEMFDMSIPSRDDVGTTNFVLITSNDEEVKRVLEILHVNAPPAVEMRHENPGYAYVMAEIPNAGIQIVPIGLSGHELIRENYTSDVLVKYDKSIADLKRKSPAGRLTILEGPPGVGKTHMVRGFMHECPDSKFVIVPPHLVAGLSDPGFIITLIREMGETGPLVMVLEDADECLVTRQTETMASISSILNLSDGIVGSLIDLRILATTNAKTQEFDAALFRKGRMSSHIKIEKFTQEQARITWQHLGGKSDKYPEILSSLDQVTLADIYAAYGELSEVEKSLGELDKFRTTAN